VALKMYIFAAAVSRMKREDMLERIRTALGRPQSGTSSDIAHLSPDGLPPARLEAVSPSIPQAELIARFEAELQKVAGSTYRAAGATELEAILRQILTASQARRVALSRNPLLSETRLAAKLSAWGMTVSEWSADDNSGAAGPTGPMATFREAVFEAEVGITGVHFVLAETGSLVLTSRSEGAQLASLAPPVHVALYRENQVLGSLDDVLERLSESGGPPAADAGRSVVFVTGPSRTADIEQVLIRGVHGPREVHAILIDGICVRP
jgi:L-lactate dehydrogenase complex protein LldG